MKKYLFMLLGTFITTLSDAQDLHFSQYYNSPILLNPANTGMLENSDWRAGVNYRNQGATIPVPYNTFSLFSDFTLFHNKWENAWLGTGFAIWRDVAGNGDLALTKVQGNLAAHILTGDKTNFSVGLGVAYNQRSVDFSKLTYDVQWDEFTFNKNVANQETFTVQKTTFLDVNAGANFTYYNNDNLFFKLSLAASHLSQPVETFYGASNKLGIRPIVNLELVYKAGDNLMLTPSVYYTRQKKASELVGGILMGLNASGETLTFNANEILIGAYYRNKDAIIGAAGYKWKQNKIMVSYDHNISQLSVATKGMGAMEISLIVQGKYKNSEERVRMYGCPRF